MRPNRLLACAMILALLLLPGVAIAESMGVGSTSNSFELNVEANPGVSCEMNVEANTTRGRTYALARDFAADIYNYASQTLDLDNANAALYVSVGGRAGHYTFAVNNYYALGARVPLLT